MKTLSTKERIIDVAITLFAKNGYTQTSMRKIAAKAGIRPSSIYNHFDSKEAILDAILYLYISTLSSHIFEKKSIANNMDKKNKESTTVAELLSRYFFTFPEQEAPKYLNILKILFSEQFHNEHIRSILLKEIQFSFLFLKKELENLSKLGRIRSCDPVLLSSLLHSITLCFATLATMGEYFLHPDYKQTNMYTLLEQIIESFIVKESTECNKVPFP